MALVIERIIIRQIHSSQRKIWTVELIIITITVVFFLIRESSFFFEVSDNTNWIVLVYTKNKTSEPIKYKFPFDTLLKIDQSEVVFINQSDIGKKSIDIKWSGDHRQGYTSWNSNFIIKGKQVDCTIYTFDDYKLNADDSNRIKALLLK